MIPLTRMTWQRTRLRPERRSTQIRSGRYAHSGTLYELECASFWDSGRELSHGRNSLPPVASRGRAVLGRTSRRSVKADRCGARVGCYESETYYPLDPATWRG